MYFEYNNNNMYVNTLYAIVLVVMCDSIINLFFILLIADVNCLSVCPSVSEILWRISYLADT